VTTFSPAGYRFFFDRLLKTVRENGFGRRRTYLLLFNDKEKTDEPQYEGCDQRQGS
jgi:hypothetical protein